MKRPTAQYMQPKAHFRARVTLKTAEDGGRESALRLRNYRPDVSFEADDRAYYGVHFVPGRDSDALLDAWISPGQAFEADFLLRAPELIMPRLRVGSLFRMMEGGRAVGNGVITLIYEENRQL